jgi:hypothetical protein
MGFRHRGIFNSISILVLMFFFSCHHSPPDIEKEISNLRKTGDIIQNDFRSIIAETKDLAVFAKLLYSNRGLYSSWEDTLNYKLNADGIFYKPLNDGRSAVFVSGYCPVDKEIRNIVYFTASFDSLFVTVVKKNIPLVTQAHFNENHSYVRMYPFIDVLNQFDPKQNINDYNVYYLADDEHNPGKKVILIDNPYVDPAGRGWIISSIAPVYYNNILEGVVGIDVTIESMKKKYATAGASDVMLLDSTGVVIMIDELKSGLFEMPPMRSHKYIDAIKSNEYMGDEYNLLNCKNKAIRNAFTELLRNKKTSTTINIDDDKYYLISYMVPDVNWYIIKFIKES